jgi:hypothetical protein
MFFLINFFFENVVSGNLQSRSASSSNGLLMETGFRVS